MLQWSQVGLLVVCLFFFFSFKQSNSFLIQIPPGILRHGKKNRSAVTLKRRGLAGTTEFWSAFSSPVHACSFVRKKKASGGFWSTHFGDNGRRNEKDHDSCIWFWKNLEGNVPGASGLPASTETRVVWLPLCTADVASYMLVSHETSMYMCTGWTEVWCRLLPFQLTLLCPRTGTRWQFLQHLTAIS